MVVMANVIIGSFVCGDSSHPLFALHPTFDDKLKKLLQLPNSLLNGI